MLFAILMWSLFIFVCGIIAGASGLYLYLRRRNACFDRHHPAMTFADLKIMQQGLISRDVQ